MHRQFARAHYYKSLSQNDSDCEEEEEEAEPSFSSQIQRLLPDAESDHFNIAVGVVITCNAIILGLETDLGQHPFVVWEHFFGIFFTAEMCLRISQLGCVGYVSTGTNSFDCLLVCAGDFDLWVSPFLSPDGEEQKGGSAKFLKLLRMFRVMRIVRLFKMFHELQIIMEAFIKALHTVMWVGLLTIILNYIVAVFLTQTIGHNAAMWGDEHSRDIEIWFGTIGHSMRTLFIIITLAEWDHIALVVSEHVPGLVVFVIAIAYITLTAFTMVSLITGIISEELVGAQREDEAHKLERLEKGKNDLAEHVKHLLGTVDDDGSGFLSEEEIKLALQDPKLKLLPQLQAMDISLEMEDFEGLITRLKEAHQAGDPNSDEIPIDDIAQALKHLSGTASSSSIWDLKMLLIQLQKDGARTGTVCDGIGDQLTGISDTFLKSTSERRKKVDEAISRIGKIEERFETDSAYIDQKLNKLVDSVGRLEEKCLSQKSRSDGHVMDRLTKLEEIMHVLCSSLVSPNNSNAAGTGESHTVGAAGTGESDAVGAVGGAAYVNNNNNHNTYVNNNLNNVAESGAGLTDPAPILAHTADQQWLLSLSQSYPHGIH